MRLLRQVADRAALREEGLAEELGVLAGHDPQQRALAGAVQAEHADLGAGQEREPDVLEDDVVGGMDLPQPFHDVDVLRHAVAIVSRSEVEPRRGDRRRAAGSRSRLH